MGNKIDLGNASWTLAGWTPNLWKLNVAAETGSSQKAEIPAFPVQLPCSVQMALRDRGLLPDMYTGFRARECEWVENRHWIYECRFEAELAAGRRYEVVLPGVDAAGWVRFDNVIAGTFRGAHREHRIALPPGTGERRTHRLEIIFDSPTRFAGQFGDSSKMPVDKPRFYYTWDWIPRLVQTAITRMPYIADCDAPGWDFDTLWTDADAKAGTGEIFLRGTAGGIGELTVTLLDGDRSVLERRITAGEFAAGVSLRDIPVELWRPNLSGAPRLYRLAVAGGGERREIAVGFKQVRWLPCAGAPEGADPWLCEVNGEVIFLQGMNWTPIRAFYADVTEEEYRLRLEHYRDMGCNILRVWGGASLEPECFYRMCDEMGLLLWQEFPLSSSGGESMPPSDPAAMAEMAEVAAHYLKLVPRHVSLLAWSGGNELQDADSVPCDTSEPMLAMLAERAAAADPRRRFMAASASGPYEFADMAYYGKGLLWDVHGPWRWPAPLEEGWFDYWDRDDALFRSEFGCPGAADAEVIRRYAGGEASYPCSKDTPLWRYPLDWWSENDVFVRETGREPRDLEEYVDWSQKRQARALGYAVAKMKERFPRCGGAILWMGHDSFPCCANTSMIDFEGNLKPAARTLRDVFRNKK